MPGRPADPARDEQLRDLHAKGLDTRTIAQIMDRHLTTVRKRMRQLGLVYEAKPHRNLTERDKTMIRRLHGLGLATIAIARIMERHRSVIDGYIWGWGLQSNYKRGWPHGKPRSEAERQSRSEHMKRRWQSEERERLMAQLDKIRALVKHRYRGWRQPSDAAARKQYIKLRRIYGYAKAREMI